MSIFESNGKHGLIFDPQHAADQTLTPTLPWLRNPSRPANSQLCEICAHLDFRTLFDIVISEFSFNWLGRNISLEHGIRLGTLEEVQNNKACQFCSVICGCFDIAQLPPRPKGATTNFWLSNFATTAEGRTSLIRHQKKRGAIAILLEISVRVQIRQDGHFKGPPLSFPVFQLQAINDSHPRLGPSLPTAQTQMRDTQYWRLLKWMDACEACYEQPSKAQSMSPLDFHEKLQLHSLVVDINRRRIVKAPKLCRYVALSYVWGGRNFSQLDSKAQKRVANDGSFDFQALPRTIKDAIALCRHLGERYLWVDSLCIPQDSQEKHYEIKSMEAIYRGAALTIVAAAGDHADVGLPGFSAGVFSLGDQTCYVQGYKMAKVSPSFVNSVDVSAWNTRAWTYQERLLSRRLIIFTEDQIYLECEHGKVASDTCVDPHDPDHVRHLTKTNAFSNDKYQLELRNRVNFTVYAQTVTEYTQRVLSYSSDIENAFGGIQKIVSILFGGSQVLYGMPVASLVTALLWTPATALIPRTGREAPTHKLKGKGRVTDMLSSFRWFDTPTGLDAVNNFASAPNPIDHFSSDSPVNNSSSRERLLSVLNLSRRNLFRSTHKNDHADSRMRTERSPWDDGILDTGSDITLKSPSRTASGVKQMLAQDLPLEIPLPDHEKQLYPSWSWIGWIGAVHYPDVQNFSERNISRVCWQDPLNKLRPLPNEDFGRTEDTHKEKPRWVRQTTSYDEVYYTLKNGDRQHWYCHPMDPFIHDPIPIDRNNGTLHFSASVANFRVRTSEHHPDEGRYLSLLTSRNVRAGLIILDAGDYNMTLQSTYSLVRISQTTLHEGRDDPAWSSGWGRFTGSPGGPAVNTANMSLQGAEKLFDTRAFDPSISWCLYNVLVVSSEDGRRRIGIGKVHVHAFDEIAKPEQNIRLE